MESLKIRKHKARPTPPLMAALPKERLEAFSPPFTNVGVDFFSPMHVVMGGGESKSMGVYSSASLPGPFFLKLLTN